MRRARWMTAAVLAGLAAVVPRVAAEEAGEASVEATPVDPEEVGGLLGVFWSAATETPTTAPDATPTPEPTATAVPEPTATATPEPTTSPMPMPMPVPTATPSVPVLGVEPPPEARSLASPTPEASPAPSPPPAATPRPSPTTEPSPTPDLEADLRASRRPPPEVASDPGSIHLPTEEIRGEIERPDIFFLLPKARSQSDEQLIRSRIRREITRPLVKDWLEEELLLE